MPSTSANANIITHLNVFISNCGILYSDTLQTTSISQTLFVTWTTIGRNINNPNILRNFYYYLSLMWQGKLPGWTETYVPQGFTSVLSNICINFWPTFDSLKARRLSCLLHLVSHKSCKIVCKQITQSVHPFVNIIYTVFPGMITNMLYLYFILITYQKAMQSAI